MPLPEIVSRFSDHLTKLLKLPLFNGVSSISKNIKIKIYRTIILPVVLYGCETVTHTEGGM